MHITIVTDAWRPQINGVVNTLMHTRAGLEAQGHRVSMITPDTFRTIPCPTYPDIRLSLFPGPGVRRMLTEFAPDWVHIATEGPLGLAARNYCVKNKRSFTTAYHTQFPEYIYARCRLPLSISYRWMRWFHGPSKALMVPTRAMHSLLAKWGFRNLAMWSRGCDTSVFTPGEGIKHDDPHPIFLYAGRVAVEKSIEEFLKLDLPGTKWVVGDGPARTGLERQYPDAKFFGMKLPPELVDYYRAADVFVFPSRTDTFGLVLAEAMACGVPVAAFPVTGPIDVVEYGVGGILNEDLRTAALDAMSLRRDKVREFSLQYSWDITTQQFLANMRIPADNDDILPGVTSATPATEEQQYEQS